MKRSIPFDIPSTNTIKNIANKLYIILDVYTVKTSIEKLSRFFMSRIRVKIREF